MVTILIAKKCGRRELKASAADGAFGLQSGPIAALIFQ